MSGVIKAVTWLSVLFGMACWGFVGFRIAHYPENHVGWNILWLVGLFAVTAGLSVAGRFCRGKVAKVALAFAVISIAAVLLIYHFNILIPYEVWLERGMPERLFLR